tara:strand:+ start:6595 stop:7452 length:858 start_codon:yes stop_codon:yes gene_type:complete
MVEEKIDGEKKIYFEPSTIEDVDRSVYNFVKGLDLQVKTNKGMEKVPVLWGSPERSFLGKNDIDSRDSQGLLKFPVISIKRSSLTKPTSSSGLYQGYVQEVMDQKGGSIIIGSSINQEKTNAYLEAERNKQAQGTSSSYGDKKIVYETISVPMPVNIDVSYEIILRTEYQQQANDLVMPFLSRKGSVNFIPLQSGTGHKYEGFIQPGFQSGDNLTDFSSDERKFQITINLRVVAYLIDTGANRERPFFTVRESVVEIKQPKERVIIDPKKELPDELLKKYNLLKF